jgi:hypothetical protein
MIRPAWPRTPPEITLRLRVGLHTGEVVNDQSANHVAGLNRVPDGYEPAGAKAASCRIHVPEVSDAFAL